MQTKTVRGTVVFAVSQTWGWRLSVADSLGAIVEVPCQGAVPPIGTIIEWQGYDGKAPRIAKKGTSGLSPEALGELTGKAMEESTHPLFGLLQSF